MASRARGQGVNRRSVPPRRTFRYWPEAQGQQSPGVQDGCRLLQPPPPHKPCRAVPGCSGPWPGRALAAGITWWEAGLSCPLPGKVHRATPSTSPQNSPVTPEGDAVSSGPGMSQSGTSPRCPRVRWGLCPEWRVRPRSRPGSSAPSCGSSLGLGARGRERTVSLLAAQPRFLQNEACGSLQLSLWPCPGPSQRRGLTVKLGVTCGP